MNTQKIKIIFGVIGLSLIWGSTWLAIKIGLEDFPPMQSAAVRFVIASVVLYLWMKRKKISFPRSRKYLGQTALLGLLMYFIPYALVYWAELTISSGMAAVMFSSMTFFVVFFAHFLLADEKITLPKFTGLLIGFSGIVMAFWDSIEISGVNQLYGMIAMILSAASGGFALVWLKRTEPDLNPVHLVTSQIMFTALLFVITGGVFEYGIPLRWTMTAVASFLYLALIGSALAFVIYYWLLANAQAMTASFGIFPTPIIALFLGWLILDEPITPKVIIGTVLLLAGIAMTYWKKRKRT
jgi:drug/metabolite transporter (DMT)-like permease